MVSLKVGETKINYYVKYVELYAIMYTAHTIKASHGVCKW